MRVELMNDVISLIEQTGYFVAKDFVVEHKTSKDAETSALMVQYRFDGQYLFRAILPRRRTKTKDSPFTAGEFEIGVRLSPGALSSVEEVTYRGKNELLEGIGAWLGCVRGELEALPMARRLQEQEEVLQKLVAAVGDTPDRVPTREEVSNMQQKLKDLESKLTENIHSNFSDKAVLQQKIQELQREFTQLKSTIDGLTLRAWIGTFLVRIARWSTRPENQKLMPSGVEMARKFLGPGETGE
ncbi:MAG: hypothetical protein JNK82_14760 [Myxococcaceae bacterium]|nr:hypothetical protein [Myxococcaceae bacterium]